MTTQISTTHMYTVRSVETQHQNYSCRT